jgi:hypothetical protein
VASPKGVISIERNVTALTNATKTQPAYLIRFEAVLGGEVGTIELRPKGPLVVAATGVIGGTGFQRIVLQF